MSNYDDHQKYFLRFCTLPDDDEAEQLIVATRGALAALQHVEIMDEVERLLTAERTETARLRLDLIRAMYAIAWRYADHYAQTENWSRRS